MTASRKDQLRFGKAAHSNVALKRKKILLGAIVAVIVLSSVTVGVYLLASYLWSSTNNVPKGNGQKVKVNGDIKGKKPKEKQRRSTSEESTGVGQGPFGGTQQVGLNTFDQAAWQRQQQQAYWVRAEQDRLRQEHAYRRRQEQGNHWRTDDGAGLSEWQRRNERQRQEAWQQAQLSRSQASRQRAQPWQPDDPKQRAQPWQPEDSRRREDADGRSAEQERLVAEQADLRAREAARWQTEVESMRAHEELNRMRREGMRQTQLREEDEARWREEQERSRARHAVPFGSVENERLRAELMQAGQALPLRPEEQGQEAEHAYRWSPDERLRRRPDDAGQWIPNERGRVKEGWSGMEQEGANQYGAAEWATWQLSPVQLEQLHREQREAEVRMMATWEPDWTSQADDGDAWSYGSQGSCNVEPDVDDDYVGVLQRARWLTLRRGDRISRRIGIKHSMILMQYRSAKGLIRVVAVQKFEERVFSNILCKQPRDTACDLDEAQRVAQGKEKRGLQYEYFREWRTGRQRLYWKDHESNIHSTVPGKLPYDFVNSNCHHYAASIWDMAFLDQTVWVDVRMPNRDKIAKLISVPNPWGKRRMEFDCNLFDEEWISSIKKWHPEPKAYLREYCLKKGSDKDPFQPRHFHVINYCPWKMPNSF